MDLNKERVLLTVLPPWDCEKPPLGAACLATYLKSIGVSVEVLDMNIELYHKSPQGIRNSWNGLAVSSWLENEFAVEYNKEFQNYIDRILSYGCKVLGFSINTSMSIYFLRELILQIKKKETDKIIVVGGPGCFFSHDRQVLRGAGVDFFVVGQGEFALEWLLRRLEAKDYFKNDEKCRLTKEQNEYSCVEAAQEYSLDTLPLPNFEEFNLSLYARPVLPLRWSRGCIRNCVFCLDRVFSGTYIPGSVPRVISGMKFYVEKYGIKDFRFIDNLINGNLLRLAELCGHIIEEDLPVSWEGQIAVRSDMDKSFFVKLKKAKCRRLELGVESFSDKVLLAMNKGFRVKDATQNIIDAKAAGLNVSIFIIVGFPGEEEADFEVTIESLKRYCEYIDEIGNLTLCSIPFGTDMYINPGKYNIASQCRQGLKEFWLKWSTNDNSNNFEVRLKRYQRLKSVLKELKISYKDNLEPVI